MNEFYALMNRLKYIGRWGLMHSTRTENVMEHSAMTAMLAHSLALMENALGGEKANPDSVALKGLYHESAEALTGDLPTPIKYYNDKITAAYKEIERQAENRICGSLPNCIKDELTPYIVQEKDTAESRIVKAADRIAALIKCKEEIKAGNGEFDGAYKATLKALSESRLKSVEYFLENILPTFDKTIDELGGGDGAAD